MRDNASLQGTRRLVLTVVPALSHRCSHLQWQDASGRLRPLPARGIAVPRCFSAEASVDRRGKARRPHRIGSGHRHICTGRAGCARRRCMRQPTTQVGDNRRKILIALVGRTLFHRHERVKMIRRLVELGCCREERTLCELPSVVWVVAEVALGSLRTSATLSHFAAGIALPHIVVLGASR